MQNMETWMAFSNITGINMVSNVSIPINDGKYRKKIGIDKV